MNLHDFPYFTQPKNSQFIDKLQRNSLLTALHKKNLRMRITFFFGLGFCALLERRVDEIKNSKSKIIIYIYLIHHLFATTQFSIFLGHPNAHVSPREEEGGENEL